MPDLSNWNILIIDDEPDNIGVLELVFKFHKAKVRVAESGEDGIASMEEEMPTLLLADIQMPTMSGYELLKKVRENDKWRHIPVIAVTALAMSGDNERILSHGFDGYIPKPVSAMTIADEVQAILDARKS